LIWYALGRDTPGEHPWVGKPELALIEAGLPAPEAATKARLSWTQIFSNKDVVIVTLSYFTYGYAAFIFFAWFYIYLSDVRGVDLKRSGWLTTLPFIAMAGGSLLGGWLSDAITKARGKRQGRCLLAAGAIGLAAVLIALGTRIADTNTAVLYLAAGAGALYLSQSSFWSVSADIGKKSAGSVSGVMNMGAQTGSAITATLTPYIGGHFGWNASFLVAAGLCACGAVAWLFVNPIESQSR
jgi:ACS family glucarate transporter-like MFS transporter